MYSLKLQKIDRDANTYSKQLPQLASGDAKILSSG